MKITYPCGCEYDMEQFIGNDEYLHPDYVDDDGYSYKLCDVHTKMLTTKW